MPRTAAARKPEPIPSPTEVAPFVEDPAPQQSTPQQSAFKLPAHIPPDIANRPHASWHTIHPSPLNPRKHFDPQKLAELAESIAIEGINQNIQVRPADAAVHGSDTYEIVAGERRWRAVELLISQGRAEASYPVPILCREMDDTALLSAAMTENVHQGGLLPMEEARGFKAMEDRGLSTDEIARQVGMSRRFVQDRLGLVKNLSDEVQASLEQGEIAPVYGRTLASAPRALQNELLHDVLNRRYASADELRDDIRRQLIPESHAVFDLTAYTGDWIEGEKAGQRYFGDIEQFKKLQFKAARAKAEEIEKDGAAWTKVTNAFYEHQFNVKAGHKDAGALIVVAEDGKMSVHKHLVYKPEFKPAPQTAKATPAAAEKKQPAAETAAWKLSDDFNYEHAALTTRRRIHALQEALYQSPADCMRILCFALLSVDAPTFLPLDRSHDHDCGSHPQVRRSFQKLLSKMPPAARAGLSFSDGDGIMIDVISAQAQAARMAALFKLSDSEVARLFSHTVAGLVGYTDLGELGDTSDVIALAAALGIAGKEAQNGLAMTPDDTTGLGLGALKAVAVDLKITLADRDKDGVEQTGTQIAQSLRIGGNKAYVLPTLRFAAPNDVAQACTAFVKRSAPKTRKAKPVAKPAVKKPAPKKIPTKKKRSR